MNAWIAFLNLTAEDFEEHAKGKSVDNDIRAFFRNRRGSEPQG